MRRTVVAAAVLVALVTLATLLRGGGADAGPDGTLALRRFIGEMGGAVVAPDDVRPGDGTLALLFDERDEREAGELLRWVEGGGRLIVADPTSHVAAALGVMPTEFSSLFPGTRSLAPRCDAPELAGIDRIEFDRIEPLLRVPRDALGCFRANGDAFLVSLPRGRGSVVILGGRSPLLNRRLRDGDNAVLAYALFRSPVGFLAPVSAERAHGFWATLPRAGRIVLIQMILAAVAFALVRARRLGRPAPEELASPIPAGELVRASARLYRVARATGFAGELLRRRLEDRLAKRFRADRDTLAEIVARDASIEPERMRRALTWPEPETDAELIALARELEAVASRAEGAER